jgi:asparagine synthase (glutamine-hydrolysing)
LTPKALSLRGLRMLQPRNRVYTREFMRMNPGQPEGRSDAAFPDRLTGVMHYDHATGILPMLLKFGDALSMAFSVESRLPFLDHRLVEFVFSLPARHKLRGSASKGILREAMAGDVPKRILERSDKVGFRTPLGRWIAENIDDGIRPMLLSKRCRERGIFDPTRIQRLLDRQSRGPARLERSIFRWISVELWFRLFIDGEGMPAPPAVAATEAYTIR